MGEAQMKSQAPPTRRHVLTVAIAGLSGGAIAAGSAARAQEQQAAALDKAIPAAMQRAQVPGAIVGVWQDDRALYVKAFGVADTATGQPMTTDLCMPIGSNSKTFTVTAILILADRGKLGLDDPIGRYVPDVPNGSQITLRQLAQMRSGLYNYSDETVPAWPADPSRQWTPRELVAVALRKPPLFPPGTKFDYCNTNTVLLGLVVEAASGQTLESFVEQNIVKPEGMTRTVRSSTRPTGTCRGDGRRGTWSLRSRTCASGRATSRSES
jgi:D-alanyl-D-alanine carboxypeptidase